MKLTFLKTFQWFVKPENGHARLNYSGIKIYSHLQIAIKDLSDDMNKFKLALKKIPLTKFFLQSGGIF